MKFLKKRTTRIFLILLGFVCAIVLGVLDKLQEALNFPAWTKSYINYILFGAAVVIAIVELVKKLKEVKPQQETSFTPEPKKLQNTKTILLQSVEQTCKDKVNNEILEQVKNKSSCHEFLVKMTRNFYLTPNHYVMGKTSNPEEEKWNIQQQNFGLSIIGDPGNGKTYRICGWILDLIAPIRSEMISGAIRSKIPVYVSLADWDGSELKEWLAGAIAKKYSLNKNYIGYLLEEHELLPCLDGLDEMDAALMPECLKMIIRDILSYSMAFCCRREEFRQLLKNDPEVMKVQFIKILSLENLEQDEIKKALEANLNNGRQLVDFLEGHQSIYDYIKTPLFLSLFIITFHSFSDEERKLLTGMNQVTFEDKIWEKYTDEMFKEKMPGTGSRIIRQRLVIRTYLAILANKMSGTAFYLDQIQPSWLPNKFAMALYYILSRTLSGILVAIATGFFFATPPTFLGNGIIAALTVTGLTLLLNSSRMCDSYLNKLPAVTVFTIVLTVITAIYQGFSVPRSPADMRLWGSFSLTESFSGILLGLFFGCIFGYRKDWQGGSSDIQPLGKPDLTAREIAKNALRIGLRGGIKIAGLIGMAGVLIEFTFATTSFGQWLAASAKDNPLKVLLGFLPAKMLEYLSVSLLATSVGFLVGGLIFALLGGRKPQMLDDTDKMDSKKEAQGMNEEQKKNKNIRESLWIALKFGFFSSLIMTFAYSCFIVLLNKDPDAFIRAGMIGIGTGIIYFFWFGGFEVIQHWALRFCLYIYGVIPFRYSRWITRVRQLAFIRKAGSSLEFYHATLKAYNKRIINDKTCTTNVKKPVYIFLGSIALFLIIFFFITRPFYNRSNYWKHAPQLKVRLLSPYIKTTSSDTMYVMLRKGTLKIDVTGRVHVGTFSGSIGPEGTETGFFGFRMSNVYDRDTSTFSYRHGALLYEIGNGAYRSGPKELIRYTGFMLPWKKRTAAIDVKKGDTVYLSVNDRERENNTGHFDLEMRLLPDSVVTAKQVPR